MKTPTIKRSGQIGAALPGEGIYTFTDGQSGGLISIRRVDGMLRIEVYRQDADVDVVITRDDDDGIRL